MEDLDRQLESLRKKQEQIKEGWTKTGNRALQAFLVKVVPRLLGVETCSIFIYDPKKDRVWLECSTSLPERHIEVSRKGSMVGEAISTGQVVIRYDVQSSPGAHQAVDASTKFVTRDALSVPVRNRSGSQVIGVIQVLNIQGGTYRQEDQALLEELAVVVQETVESIFLAQELLDLADQMEKKLRRIEKVKGLVAGQ